MGSGVGELGNNRFIKQEGRLNIMKQNIALSALEKWALRYRNKSHQQADVDEILFESALDETGTVVSTAGLVDSDVMNIWYRTGCCRCVKFSTTIWQSTKSPMMMPLKMTSLAGGSGNCGNPAPGVPTADGGRWGWWPRHTARYANGRSCSGAPLNILFLL